MRINCKRNRIFGATFSSNFSQNSCLYLIVSSEKRKKQKSPAIFFHLIFSLAFSIHFSAQFFFSSKLEPKRWKYNGGGGKNRSISWRRGAPPPFLTKMAQNIYRSKVFLFNCFSSKILFFNILSRSIFNMF